MFAVNQLCKWQLFVIPWSDQGTTRPCTPLLYYLPYPPALHGHPQFRVGNCLVYYSLEWCYLFRKTKGQINTSRALRKRCMGPVSLFTNHPVLEGSRETGSPDSPAGLCWVDGYYPDWQLIGSFQPPAVFSWWYRLPAIPWIRIRLIFWNKQRNQNLLHRSTKEKVPTLRFSCCRQCKDHDDSTIKLNQTRKMSFFIT